MGLAEQTFFSFDILRCVVAPASSAAAAAAVGEGGRESLHQFLFQLSGECMRINGEWSERTDRNRGEK